MNELPGDPNLPPGCTANQIEDRFGPERCPRCQSVLGWTIFKDEHGMRQQRLVCGSCDWEGEAEDQ